MDLFTGLLDDAALLTPDATVQEAVRGHRSHRTAWYADLVGPLVVRDTALAEVGRHAADEPIEVSVVNTGGAGGLSALARRSVTGVRVVAVESALRDLDDLVGNAARVVAAAAELEDGVEVYVELPAVAGWVRAVEEVEAAGLYGKLRAPAAEQLSVLVEADLSFKISDAPSGLPALLLALDALIDGAEVVEAEALLATTDRERISAAVAAWDGFGRQRVRRRLRRLDCAAVPDQVEDLVAAGLIAPTSGS